MRQLSAYLFTPGRSASVAGRAVTEILGDLRAEFTMCVFGHRQESQCQTRSWWDRLWGHSSRYQPPVQVIAVLIPPEYLRDALIQRIQCATHALMPVGMSVRLDYYDL